MFEGHADAIVIGGSAGAIEALSKLLPALPAGFQPAVCIVVHLPGDQESMLAPLMQSKCALAVREAEDKEPIERGTIYFAPPNYHLQVEADRSLSLSNDEPVLFCRPSIDVLFESAADVYGAALTAVVLTGANADGAAGLKAVIEAGGTGIVQHPDTAAATAMPQAAISACPGAHVLNLEQIAQYLSGLKPSEVIHVA